MTKIFFAYQPKREADQLAKMLSMLFLAPPNAIKAEDVWLTGIRRSRKISGYTINELLTYTVGRIKSAPSMTIVEIKRNFTTDAKLIEDFGDNYLGMITAKISKSQLLTLAEQMSKREYSRYLEGWLIPNFARLEESLIKAGLDDIERKDIEALTVKAMKPVVSWVKAREINLNSQITPLTKFLVRDF
jgi:hypothetical protein